MTQTTGPNAPRRVLLGVSGGIAAYKAVELCRWLVRAGIDVRVMMTRAATHFVSPTTFAAVSGHPVATELFDAWSEAEIGHIRLAEQAEVLVLAPATANLLAKLAHGFADDVVTTVYQAYRGPVVVAPAMNPTMWSQPATQVNAELLAARKTHRLVGPAEGEAACGHVGVGRMAEPEDIAFAVVAALSVQDLAKKRVLITAGPTEEPVDPVRYLSNRSSGKMGVALAAAAAQRGAEVLLVSGPTALPAPPWVEMIRVRRAQEMAQVVRRHAPAQDVVIMAAAVSDYRPAQPAKEKLKKESWGNSPVIALRKNPDILRQVVTDRKARCRPLIVGFALETATDLAAAARAKLMQKGCDMMVANAANRAGSGFEVDTNDVLICTATGECIEVPLASKQVVAQVIVDHVVRLLAGRSR